MLRFAFNAILRRPREIGFVIDERFQHRSRVIERETNSQREQTWQKKNLSHPCARMQLALRANIEKADRGRRCKKDRNVDKHRAQPAALRGTCGGVQKNAQNGKKQVSEVGHQMPGGLQLDWKRKPAAPDGGQQFFTGLDRAFRPAMLLRLETVHVHGEFRWSNNVKKIDKFPAR